MDVLTDILSTTHLGNKLLCGGSHDPPWNVLFDSTDKTNFHIVTKGACWLHFENTKERTQLFQGDIILIPNRGRYVLSDKEDGTSFEPSSQNDPSNNGDADGLSPSSTTLICGGYHFEHDRKHPLLSLLPNIIHVRANQMGDSDLLLTIARLMSIEVSKSPIGSDIVMSRLVDILLVSILRHWITSESECVIGWLTALKDLQIGKSLSLMHKTPGKKWTVEKLAREAGMSRASFATKFQELVGEPPITYLNHWRMDVAAVSLRETNVPILEIAEKAGQKSESSFIKVFKKTRGISPGKYRAENRKAS